MIGFWAEPRKRGQRDRPISVPNRLLAQRQRKHPLFGNSEFAINGLYGCAERLE